MSVKKKVEAEKTKTEEKAEPKAVETRAPVVAPGEHYLKVKVKFTGLICAPFGTFENGDEGEIPLALAKELEKLGKAEIVKE